MSIEQSLHDISVRLHDLEKALAEVHALLLERPPAKEWYRTDEVAEALDKSDFTVREKWCNQGRIEAVKDPATGKWKISRHEFLRLCNGGGLLPRRR